MNVLILVGVLTVTLLPIACCIMFKLDMGFWPWENIDQ